MSTEKVYDFAGNEIKVGDWVAHPQTGRSGMKSAYVMGFTKSGKPRCVSFDEGTYWAGAPKETNVVAKGVFHETGGWKTGWHREGPYHIDPDNVIVIGEASVSSDILETIATLFQGDPMYQPDANQL